MLPTQPFADLLCLTIARSLEFLSPAFQGGLPIEPPLNGSAPEPIAVAMLVLGATGAGIAGIYAYRRRRKGPPPPQD